MTEIICYNCIFLQKKYEDYTVDCEMKGNVDVHGICDYYTKKELQ